MPESVTRDNIEECFTYQPPDKEQTAAFDLLRDELTEAGKSILGQLDPDISEWLNLPSLRRKIETLMTLLECSAAEAVHLHLLNCIANYSDTNDDWGDGANPEPEEE